MSRKIELDAVVGVAPAWEGCCPAYLWSPQAGRYVMIGHHDRREVGADAASFHADPSRLESPPDPSPVGRTDYPVYLDETEPMSEAAATALSVAILALVVALSAAALITAISGLVWLIWAACERSV